MDKKYKDYLLFILLGVWEKSWHVHHYLVSLVYCINRLVTRRICCKEDRGYFLKNTCCYKLLAM